MTTIRILVSPDRARGKRTLKDYTWTVGREMLYAMGGGRFGGLSTRRGTSVAQVADVEITIEQYAQAFYESHVRACGGRTDFVTLAECKREAMSLLRFAAQFQPGDYVATSGRTLEPTKVRTRPKETDDQPLILDMDDERRTVTRGAFLADNSEGLDEATLRAIVDIQPGTTVRGGGGAGSAWALTRAEGT